MVGGAMWHCHERRAASSFRSYPFHVIFQLVRRILQRGQCLGIRRPVVAVGRFQQAVCHAHRRRRVHLCQPGAHFVVQHECFGQTLVNPWFHLACGGRPADRVGDMRFDLAHAFVAMLEQALVELRVERPGPCFQCHLILQGPHLGRTTGLVPNIDRGRFAPFGPFDRPRNAAERVEIVVNGCDPQFDAFKVLIG